MDRRDEKASQIARRLAEHQRRMLNLAIQLQALYGGRKEDVAGLVKEEGGSGSGSGSGSGPGSGPGSGSGHGEGREGREGREGWKGREGGDKAGGGLLGFGAGWKERLGAGGGSGAGVM